MTARLRLLVTVRRLLTIAALVAAWCALWGSVSVANVASGLTVAIGAVVVAGGQPGAGHLRLVPLLHFVWLVAVDLVRSTFKVAWEILTPTDYTDEAIIAVDTETDARSHLLLLVVAITVTPGTAVVDTDPDTGRLYLHVLHAEDADEIVAHVKRLAALGCRALPVSECIPAGEGVS